MRLLNNGDTIMGRYRVQRQHQAGGQAIGFMAEDQQCPPDQPWKRDVFLKQYHDLPASEQLLHRMQSTVATMQDKLQDAVKYICLPQQIDITHNSIVFVFPYVKGRDLANRLQDPELTVKTRLRYAIALCKAIQHLHEAQMIHLDLKPDNVMIEESKDEFVQLIDLDAAKIDGVGLRDKVMGTPGYYSPEHAFPNRYGQVCKASDIFALGIVICELLCGDHPFNHATDYASAITSEDFFISLQSSHPLKNLLSQCLASDHNQRPTAAHLFQKLLKFRYEDGEALLGTETGSQRPEPTRTPPDEEDDPSPREDALPPMAPTSHRPKNELRLEHKRPDRSLTFQQNAVIGGREFGMVRMRNDYLHLEIGNKRGYIQLCRQTWIERLLGPTVVVDRRVLNSGQRFVLTEGTKLSIGGQMFVVRIGGVSSQ